MRYVHKSSHLARRPVVPFDFEVRLFLCVHFVGCRVVLHIMRMCLLTRMARRGAEPLARATTCTQNTMHREH